MKVGLNASGIVALVGLAVGGYVVYRLYKGGSAALSGAIDTVKNAAQQGAANVAQTWNNATSAPATQTTRNLLYGNEGYTGSASTADDPTTGEWYGNEAARRYSYEQRDAGAAPAAESINGAAFGVYPSSGKRTSEQKRYAAPPNTTNGQDQADRPPVSFSQDGGSFKDLASTDAVNAFLWPSAPLGQLH